MIIFGNSGLYVASIQLWNNKWTNGKYLRNGDSPIRRVAIEIRYVIEGRSGYYSHLRAYHILT